MYANTVYLNKRKNPGCSVHERGTDSKWLNKVSPLITAQASGRRSLDP